MLSYRLFSKKHQLYTNSPNWPSNQQTWSNWALAPDGSVLEIVSSISEGNSNSYYDSSSPAFVKVHDKRDFAVEPWTGFYDCQNKKIYLGDIIKLQCFNLDYEIVWNIDRFGMKRLFETLATDRETPEYIRGQKDFSTDWRVVNTKHGVEYCD